MRHRTRTDLVALVDEADAVRVVAAGPWFLHIKGYAVANLPGGGQVLLHRLIMGLEHGDRRQVDHRDRNPLNCQRSNMRLATSGQNRQNVTSYRGSTSQYRGVSWDAARGRWKAQGKVARRGVFIGRYATEEEAAEAAAAWRREHLPYSEEASA
jgi:hypothetical protein